MTFTVTAKEYLRLLNALVLAEEWEITSADANVLCDEPEAVRKRAGAERFRELRHKLLITHRRQKLQEER